MKKAKSRKTIRGYKIKGYRPKFSITKNLTFSGQKKMADTIEKIANKLAKTLKRIVAIDYSFIVVGSIIYFY